MKKIIKNIDDQKITLQILTIEEAVKIQRLTREEAIEYHTWHKDEKQFVDNKHIVYSIDDVHGWVSQGITENFPTDEELTHFATVWANA